MVLQRRGGGESGPSSVGEGENMWKQIWGLDVLEATRHFIRSSLWKRKIVGDPLCPICKLKEEDVMHALWNCPATMDVWGENCSPINKWPVGGKDLVQLWSELSGRLHKAKLEEVVVIMKGISHRRNNFVFQNNFTNPGRIVQTATTRLEEFHETNK